MSTPQGVAVGWVPVANLRGPRGPQGDDGEPGTGVASVSFDNAGRLVLTLTDGTSYVSTSLIGPRGDDGRSVTIAGSVATASQLPNGLGGDDAGLGYITIDDGHLHVWSGTQFVDVGNVRGPAGRDGVDGIQGPRGEQGVPGPPGQGGTYGQSFATAQAVWDITHGLNSRNVTVVAYDLNDEEVEHGVLVLDENTVRVSYEFPASGRAVVQR